MVVEHVMHGQRMIRGGGLADEPLIGLTVGLVVLKRPRVRKPHAVVGGEGNIAQEDHVGVDYQVALGQLLDVGPSAQLQQLLVDPGGAPGSLRIAGREAPGDAGEGGEFVAGGLGDPAHTLVGPFEGPLRDHVQTAHRVDVHERAADRPTQRGEVLFVRRYDDVDRGHGFDC